MIVQLLHFHDNNLHYHSFKKNTEMCKKWPYVIRKHFSISFNQTNYFSSAISGQVWFEHFQAFLHSSSNCVNYEDNKTRFHAMFFIFTIKLSTTSPNSRTVSNKGAGGQLPLSFWQISFNLIPTRGADYAQHINMDFYTFLRPWIGSHVFLTVSHIKRCTYI